MEQGYFQESPDWYRLCCPAQVALLLIDEVHLLNESRGAALEAGVVSRVRMISSLPSVQMVRGRTFHAYKDQPLLPHALDYSM